MADCMRKCCGNTDCDIAYFLEKKCYQVACSTKEACRPLAVKASKDSPLMSAMIMRPKPKKPTGKIWDKRLLLPRISGQHSETLSTVLSIILDTFRLNSTAVGYAFSVLSAVISGTDLVLLGHCRRP